MFNYMCIKLDFFWKKIITGRIKMLYLYRIKLVFNLQVINRDLESSIKNEENGDFGKILRSIISGGRARNHGYDPELIKNEAKSLFEAGKNKIGTDESELIRIFCSRSYPELYSIFAVYEDEYKNPIETMIRRETSGNLMEALLAIGWLN